MLRLEIIPKGAREIFEVYGTPGKIVDGRFEADPVWAKENLRRFSLPFPLRQSWDQTAIQSLVAHKLVGGVMVDALEEIHTFYGLAHMRKYNLDRWGGVYNPRFKIGSKEPSTHAWGIAIDYCPDLAPYGEPSRMPWPIHEAFLKRGFINLPDDGMHYQAADEY